MIHVVIRAVGDGAVVFRRSHSSESVMPTLARPLIS